MTTICREGGRLLIGADFADAMAGKVASRGVVEVNGPAARMAWQSTFGTIEAERALRDLAERCDGAEGVRADGSNIQTMRASALLRKLGEE